MNKRTDEERMSSQVRVFLQVWDCLLGGHEMVPNSLNDSRVAKSASGATLGRAFLSPLYLSLGLGHKQGQNLLKPGRVSRIEDSKLGSKSAA